MPRRIGPPAQTLALRLGDRRYSRLAGGIIQRPDQRVAQRADVIRRHHADQTCEARKPRKISTACSVRADEQQSAGKRLALHQRETFLPRSENKNMSLVIELLELPLRNRVVMHKPRMARKRGIKQGPDMNEPHPIEI